MTEPDEPLFEELKKILTGLDNDDVIPVLIVAAARALVLMADGDSFRLDAGIAKFHALMNEQAQEMFKEEHPPDGR